MSFDRVALRPARILLPAPSVPRETWACIACDQYTSEPEYWEKAYKTAGDAPSALRLILPEIFLKQSVCANSDSSGLVVFPPLLLIL